MKKTLFTLSATAIMMGGLVGCAGNNDAMDTNYNTNATRPIGYYSNENTERNGNARTLTDNDGPITEMLDRAGDRDNNRGARTNRTLNERNWGTNNTGDVNHRRNNTGIFSNRNENNNGLLGRNNHNYRNGNGVLDNDNNTGIFGTNNNRTNNFGTLGNNRDQHAGVNRANDNRFFNFGAVRDNNHYGTNNTTHRSNNFFSGLRDNGNFGTLGTDRDNLDGNYATSPYAVPGNPYAARGNKTMEHNKHDRADLNYHGHVDDNTDQARNSAYYTNYNGDLADRIVERAERVKNVDDAHAVVMGDDVVVAIDTNDNNDKNVTNEVEDSIKSLTKNKDVRVITDEATFTRVRDINNDMRTGHTTPDTINEDLGDLFENIGQTIRRPFSNNK
ncbi:YhcN/YlaJ family sporulation lipoprotein [Litchfieldia alkalitelluris]|uniref:YhcN/YlaJ family sporulation lipoprotein n=1 Tax=Litchfieldia alkalitelluris TaxID=304268 RepID=UPI0009983B67|nr:YhcN/YlaJ family sporulation lipoprotein [Litchfieldia alkalitelluris]